MVFFAVPFFVFVFLVLSGLGKIVFVNHLTHLVVLLAISIFSFYVTVLSYRAYDRGGDLRMFALSLSFYSFGFFFLIHGLIIPDIRQKIFLFNPSFFNVALNYGLLFGSLWLLGLVLPLRTREKFIYKNRLKIFSGAIFSLFAFFLFLMLFPPISEVLKSFSGVANLFMGGIFFVVLIFLLLRLRRKTDSFDFCLLLAFSVLSNLVVISLFAKDWNIIWWYFHLVFLIGFGLVFFAVIKGCKKKTRAEDAFALDKIRFGIKAKMTIAFLFVAVVPLIVFGCLSFLNFSGVLKDISLDEIKKANSSRADEVSCFLKPFKNEVVFLSDMPDLNAFAVAQKVGGQDMENRRADLEGVFKALMESQPSARAQISYLDGKGMELARVESREGKTAIVSLEKLRDEGNKPYFIKAMKLKKGEVYVSAPRLIKSAFKYQPEKHNVSIMRYATPVFSLSGERKGVVAMDVFIGDFLRDFQKKGKHRGELVFLVDRDGFYLSHPNESKMWGGVDDFNTGDNIKKDLPSVASRILSGKRGVIVGKDVVGYAPVFPGGENMWIFVSVIPKDLFWESIGSLKNILFSLSLIIAALVSALAFMFANSFTYPIRELSDVSKRISEGDLKTRSEIKSKDEIGKLAASFNRMADNLLEARHFPENILHSMKEALFVVDTKGDISKINRVALKILGYKKSELLGKPISRVFAKKNKLGKNKGEEEMGARAGLKPSLVHLGVDELITAGLAKDKEISFLSKDGGLRPVDISVSALRSRKGGVQGMVITARDLSELQKLQKEKLEITERAKEEAEKLVKERTAQLNQKISELERFNNLAVDRELKMIELKKKIALLEKKASGDEENKQPQKS